MQPILADSAPHRRPLVLAAVLSVAALVAAVAIAVPQPHHGHRQRHHKLPHNGKCPYGYVYVQR